MSEWVNMSENLLETVNEVPVSISDIASPGDVPGYTRPIETKGLSVVERIDRYREHAVATNGPNPEVSPAIKAAVRKALQHEAFLLQKKEDEDKQGKSRDVAETIDFALYAEPEAQSPIGPVGDGDGEYPSSLGEALGQRERYSDDQQDKMLDDMVVFFGTPVEPINFEGDGDEGGDE